jgi:3-methyladenine DNA glycosylase AlkD
LNTQGARELGKRLAGLVQVGEDKQAYALLAPVLVERTSFSQLELLGTPIGAGGLKAANRFLDRIAASREMGGWVVIGAALREQLPRDLNGVFARCRNYITQADVWYATDILGERVPGPALVTEFGPALKLLVSWRADDNAWIRRTVGVAVHFWAKRSRSSKESAETLLSLLEPMFEESRVDAVKGVGWGLKTLGRYYPTLVADWLDEQVAKRRRRPRALMLRKATMHLPAELRDRIRAMAGMTT